MISWIDQEMTTRRQDPQNWGGDEKGLIARWDCLRTSTCLFYSLYVSLLLFSCFALCLLICRIICLFLYLNCLWLIGFVICLSDMNVLAVQQIIISRRNKYFNKITFHQNLSQLLLVILIFGVSVCIYNKYFESCDRNIFRPTDFFLINVSCLFRSLFPVIQNIPGSSPRCGSTSPTPHTTSPPLILVWLILSWSQLAWQCMWPSVPPILCTDSCRRTFCFSWPSIGTPNNLYPYEYQPWKVYTVLSNT